LEFIDGGLWRYYERDWFDDFWRKCKTADGDFSPEVISNPESGLIS
jgi:hypothetical protein